MSVNGVFLEQVPLAVLLFHEAMSRNQSLSKFAGELDIGTLSLRQLMLGKTRNPRQKTLNAVCEALQFPPDEVNRRMEQVPTAAPAFKDWLKAQMAGRFTRSKLSQDTKISDGALRNYLSGQTLPDADQAQRLAEVLGVAPLEVASVVVANEVLEAGGVLATPPPTDMLAEDEASAPAQPSEAVPATPPLAASGYDETQLLGLWRQLHPQGRRATLGYIAMLLAER